MRQTSITAALSSAILVGAVTVPSELELQMVQDRIESDKLVAFVAMAGDIGMRNNHPIHSFNETFDFCTITPETPCNTITMRAHQSEGKHGWLVFPGGDTKCMDGSPFAFTVYPGDNTHDNTLFWFQQGGACYSYETCQKLGVAYNAFNPEMEGIFNYAEPQNPIANKGWTTIVNNYCTGDAFMGTAKNTYSDEPWSNATVEVEMVGATNTLAIFEWLDRQPDAKPTQKFAIGGSSAGSLGAQFWAQYMEEKYNITHILLDSYIGDFTPAAGLCLKDMGICDTGRKILNWSTEFADLCDAGKVHEMKGLFSKSLKALVDIPVAYVGSTLDLIQSAFYVITSTSDESQMAPYMMAMSKAAKEFPVYLMDTLAAYEKINPNFGHYIVESNTHTFCPHDWLYQANMTTAANETDYTMLNFIDDFMNNGVYGKKYPVSA